jgi:hypothetical protein
MTDGLVGIGTRTPQSKLDVQGSITASEDIVLTRADCAEEFDIEDGSETEPGTVMVIGGRRALRHSTNAYDPRVAGIVGRWCLHIARMMRRRPSWTGASWRCWPERAMQEGSR